MKDGTKILVVGLAAYFLFMRQSQAQSGAGASSNGAAGGSLTGGSSNGAAGGSSNGIAADSPVNENLGPVPGGTGSTFFTAPSELFPGGIPQSATGYQPTFPELAGA